MFQQFRVSKKFMLQRVMSGFSVGFFCLTVPKNLIGEPLCAVFQKIYGSEKAYGQEGGEFQDFPSKIFCLTVPKISVGESFSVSLVSGIENVRDKL